MDKRVIVFLVLSLLIIVGYDFLMKQLGYLPSDTAEQQASDPVVVSESAQTSGKSEQEAGQAPGLSPTASLQSGETNSTPGDKGEQIVRIETDLYRVELSSRGGVVKTWELKQYAAEVGEGSPPVQLVYKTAQFPRPLSVRFPDDELTKELAEGLYDVEQGATRLDNGTRTGRVTFRYRNSAGVEFEKVLTFHHDSYLVDVALRAQGVSGPVEVGLGANFGIVEWGDGFIGLIGPASLVNDKIEKDTPATESERTGHVTWAAIQDKYFISVLIPRQGEAVLVKKELEKVVSTSVRMPLPASGDPVEVQLYAGPKEYDTLRAFNIGIEDTIDFGWFIYGSWGFVKMVAKPLFAVLRTINEVTQNFGLTIILLTVVIKLLFAPLQYKSYKSMKDMQLIQPKVQAIQEKYKDDRERLNKELISLYRDHKVNPVGGCLPMFLQMPVFVALFNILYMTIDLRQAPFLLWVKDLSVPDPYYVLPIIMGATMVVQQKITPTTMDPTQAKIMLVLPVMLTFLFLTFPAGLVLYWLTNNTLTIVQQFVTERYLVKRPA